jgi:predicted nuclease of restriction endonuclease-like (RecB) superfamily
LHSTKKVYLNFLKRTTMQLEQLIDNINQTSDYFQKEAVKQVNIALTLRNWVIGFYLFEYEQKGRDRAIYGTKLYAEIASRLKHHKGLSKRNLHSFASFYRTYPQFYEIISQKNIKQNWSLLIVQTVSAQLTKAANGLEQTNIDLLTSRLSFSHFIELMKADSDLKRLFYETEALLNNWSVRELQRAIETSLFERTGLSTNKEAVIKKIKDGKDLTPSDVIRNPYFLEFLGLEEKAEYSESDLETAIINDLQGFLIELGRGFCFEARQKRITFDNTHYHIDLVFYHRILKCSVLLDLKIGTFDHSDAGQMNMYLNYFTENEMTEGDNPPIGIILCAQKNESLVRYATGGLSQQIFVSKYLDNLPNEAELTAFIQKEQDKLF